MGGLIQWLSLIRDNRLSSGETLPRNVKPTLNTWVCEAQGRVCLTAIVCRLRRYSTRRSNSRAETSGELLSYSALATQSSHGFRLCSLLWRFLCICFPVRPNTKTDCEGVQTKGKHLKVSILEQIPIDYFQLTLTLFLWWLSGMYQVAAVTTVEASAIQCFLLW